MVKRLISSFRSEMRALVRRPVREVGEEDLARGTRAVANYWTGHNVTSHRSFQSKEESLAYLSWRNDQYYGYIERMPVTGQDGLVVLDYGCGPGHDLVGFGTYSAPARLIGCDISESSIAEARRRLELHGIAYELLLLDPAESRIPLADQSVDYVHCSGVLHHTVMPEATLAEFFRVLRPGCAAAIMVYNYDSLWLHYYVAFQKLIEEGRYAEDDIRVAFSHTTDGESCPISRVYRPQEFKALAAAAGFECEYRGAALSVFEASLFPLRFKAIMNPQLREESRQFLLELEVDRRGLPVYRGAYAGVDGCFRMRRSE